MWPLKLCFKGNGCFVQSENHSTVASFHSVSTISMGSWSASWWLPYFFLQRWRNISIYFLGWGLTQNLTHSPSLVAPAGLSLSGLRKKHSCWYTFYQHDAFPIELSANELLNTKQFKNDRQRALLLSFFALNKYLGNSLFRGYWECGEEHLYFS